MYDVYLIRNEITQKCYVGYTKRGWRVRVSEHLKGRGGIPSLDEDIIKFGENSFTAEPLFTNVSTKQEACELEIDCIDKYYSHIEYGGYNTTLGGEQMLGYVHLPRHGELISKKLKNVPKSQKHKESLSKSRKGKYTKEDNPFYGKQHSLETKQILSKAMSKSIEATSLATNEKLVFDSILDASKFLLSQGVTTNKSCSSRISKCCRNQPESKTAYGFTWRFIE